MLASKGRDRIKFKIRATRPRIKVNAGVGMFNHSCFYNAVENAIRDADGLTDVFEVMMIEDGHPILHYINYHPETGYTDNTLGYRASQGSIEYYALRRIHQLDYGTIQDEFVRAQAYWSDYGVAKWLRRIIRIDVLV